MANRSPKTQQVDPGDDASPLVGLEYDPMTDAALKRRFEAKFRANDHGCWVWGGGGSGHVDADGYGQFKLNGILERAHRASWKIYRGPIEPGFDIDHKCDKAEGGPPEPDRRCVNPDHIEPVVHAENMRRIDHAPDAHAVMSQRPQKPKIDPEDLLEWALDLVDESEFEAGGGTVNGVRTIEGSPWRNYKYTFDDGLRTAEGRWALLAMYLYLVEYGVDWKLAAARLLRLNPMSMRRWDENAEWKEDFTYAKTCRKEARWKALEEYAIDTVERNIERWQGKDMVNLLKAIVKRDADKANAARRGEAPPLQVTGGVHFYLGAGAPTPEELIEGHRIMVTSRDVTSEVSAPLPPEEYWEAEVEEVASTEDE